VKEIQELDCAKIISWCENPEEGALDQAINISRLPFIVGHVALMPDTHQGYGMPIGGVIACDGVIIPNAVGVDIGCGMCAVETTLDSIDTETLKEIMGKIRAAIPVGFNHHQSPQDGMPYLVTGGRGVGLGEVGAIVAQEYKSAQKQLGTLGGGNHFIEIQRSESGRIWIMLHSGSRNIGLKVAKFYNDLAKEMDALWYSKVDPKSDTAFFPIDSEEGIAYHKEMSFCLDFAMANRTLMMDRIRGIFVTATGCNFAQVVNIHHNYAQMENHFGRNVMVHRKGATSAKEGEFGIIPGSQGTASYIVKGKGNKLSFTSCSHGAGRRMGRREAQRSLNLEAEKKLLDDQGIIHAIRGKDDLDEAAGAYKDIDVVMEEQKDLVDIVVKLRPLGVIKA